MEKENLKCKKCGSSNTYTKISTSERVCRKCGNIDKINKENKK
jgi:transcription initiation factor TFIIIB Brf1 subunit/transcription initiation factor TFIIB